MNFENKYFLHIEMEREVAKLYSYMARHNIEVENDVDFTALINGISQQVSNEYIELTPELIDILISIQEKIDEQIGDVGEENWVFGWCSTL